MTRRDQVIKEYRAAYIADFGEDPPILEPSPGFGFEMNDENFPQHTTFFNGKEIKQMIAWMRERTAKKRASMGSNVIQGYFRRP